MRTEKNIREELKKVEGELERDNELDCEEALPCCDRARLEEWEIVLSWVLDTVRKNNKKERNDKT